MNRDISLVTESIGKIRHEVEKVIIGQGEVIDLALVAILAGQHALIEGVPGVGKTLLVRTLARAVGGKFSRIQFTPDLMPADITGTTIFNMKLNEFTFNPGPLFTTFLLADEINRAPAKTQSALLQAMQEKLVTIDRRTYTLPAVFSVFATQNPVEFEGTYALPEAQRDRFMLKITMEGPGREDELSLIGRTLGADSPEEMLAGDEVKSVVSTEGLLAVREGLRKIRFGEDIVGYAVDIVRSSRSHESVLLGGGPRAAQSLVLAARAFAAVSGRDFVTPDDVKQMALPVLEHRLILQPDYEIEGVTAAEVVGSILQDIAVPR
jgi:MoxR-like ATPase